MKEPAKTNDIECLQPDLKRFFPLLAAEWKRLHPDDEVILTETDRSQARQDWLFAAGRDASALKFQTFKTQLAETGGERPFYWRPMEPRVTWTLRRKHQGGRAMDVAIKRAGKITWDDALYVQLAQLGQRIADANGFKIFNLGLRSGKDYPHWEVA